MAFFHIFKLSRVLSLPCRLLNICHGDKDNDISLDKYATPLGFVDLDSELLNIVNKLATEVKARCNERLELIECVRHGGSLRGVEYCLEEEMKLNLVGGLRLGAV